MHFTMESTGLWKVMALSHEAEFATFHFASFILGKYLLTIITMGSENIIMGFSFSFC